jgi:hypothetical protein
MVAGLFVPVNAIRSHMRHVHSSAALTGRQPSPARDLGQLLDSAARVLPRIVRRVVAPRTVGGHARVQRRAA